MRSIFCDNFKNFHYSVFIYRNISIFFNEHKCADIANRIPCALSLARVCALRRLTQADDNKTVSEFFVS